jgi:hypothetical protein
MCPQTCESSAPSSQLPGSTASGHVTNSKFDTASASNNSKYKQYIYIQIQGNISVVTRIPPG